MKSLRVLSIASEIFPLIKIGELADVTGALPLALKSEGIEIRTVVPGYPSVMNSLASRKRRRSSPDPAKAASQAAGSAAMPESSTTCANTSIPKCSSSCRAMLANATRVAVSRALARSSTARGSRCPNFWHPARSACPGRGLVGTGSFSMLASWFTMEIAVGEPSVEPARVRRRRRATPGPRSPAPPAIRRP